MELTKKIWHDENSEPPKNYLWAKGGKLFKNIEGQWKEVSKKESEDEGSGDGGDDSGSEEINIGQAWKKALNDYINLYCPVKPSKVHFGIIPYSDNYELYQDNDGAVLEYLDETPDSIAIQTTEDQDLFDIDNIPDRVYENYGAYDIKFELLYSLDELNSKSDEIKQLNSGYRFRPYKSININSYEVSVETYTNNNNVIKLLDGKYYVSFELWSLD